jgi:hypothetical protein
MNMSIYADNYIVDEVTGEVKLVKHLNKFRMDRGRKSSSKWNKSGKDTRRRKHLPTLFKKGYKKRLYQLIQKGLNKKED